MKPKETKGVNLKKIEADLEITIPARLRIFYETHEYQQYEGCFVYGLEHYTEDTKFKVKFIKKFFSDLLEDNDIEMPDDEEAYYLPFISLGEEPQFLAVDITKEECPVSMWEHEDGLFYLHSKNLDEFLLKLLKKGGKTPFEKFENLIKKATIQYEEKNYKKALDILNRASTEISLQVPEKYEAIGTMGTFFNLRGICYEKNENIDQAIENYNMALACGETNAELNLIDLYLNIQKNYPKALEAVLKIEEEYLSEYAWYHVKNYKGLLSIRMGDNAEAEKVYKLLLDKYSKPGNERIEESISDLQEIAAESSPQAEIAATILKWFGPKQYDLTEEETRQNKEWWDGLPSVWKTKLLDTMKLKTAVPSNLELAKILDLESLRFEEKEPLSDLTPFERFKNLKRVYFYGDVENLDIFKNMKSLDRLTYNGEVNKNFKVPSKDAIRLIEAAGNGDLNKVKEYLAKGVDVNIILDHKTALSASVFGHHQEVSIYLIRQGADIYKRIGYDLKKLKIYCEADIWEKFEEEFEKSGGMKKETNFVILKKNYAEKNVCSLGYLENVDREYELTDGLSRKDNFPDYAFFAMRKDYTGYKKDIRLEDCFLEKNLIIGNSSVKKYFEDKEVKNVEILPVRIKDHAGAFIAEPYFIINPLACDCLDIEKSDPTYNHIDPNSINEVQSLIIDEARLPSDIQVFRIKNYSYGIIMRKTFAIQLSQMNFSGITFDEV